MRGTVNTIYCIDASAFIYVVHHLPEDNFKGVWEDMGDLVSNGRLIMPKIVRDECQDPESQNWLEVNNTIVRPFTPELNNAVFDLQSDLNKDNQFLEDPKSSKSKGDPWLIALAMAENWILSGSYASGDAVVVCHEEFTRNPTGKVKIPDVCIRYGIECLKFTEVVRREGWKFIRG